MPMDVVVDQAAPVGDEVSKLANQFSLPEDYDITVRHPDTKVGKFELRGEGGKRGKISEVKERFYTYQFAVSPLSRELTFAEQDVAEHCTLFLKPKVYFYFIFNII